MWTRLDSRVGTPDAARTRNQPAGVPNRRLSAGDLDGSVGAWSRSAYGPNRGKGDCGTAGALVVGAGPHSVDLEVEVGAGTTALNGASVWALWVPLDGSGAVPTP